MDLLEVTKEQIESFLSENFKRLKNPEYMFGIDNNQDKAEDFSKAGLKILAVFNSTGETRAVSNTFNVLSWIVHKELGNNVFIDSCYLPEQENVELLSSNNIPWMFGNVSHRPISEYDLIFMSVNIVPEVLNIPHYLRNSGIPFSIEERNKDNRVPPIIIGGAGASESAILLGPVDYNGVKGKSLIDMALYGFGEEFLPELVRKTLDYKSLGFDVKNKPQYYEWLISLGVLHDKLFFPQFYDWVYDESGQVIKEIKVLDDRLPKRVKFSRMISNKFDGFPLKNFHLAGTNATAVDIQVANGCSGASSCCSFCQEGTVAGNYYEKPLEDVIKIMKFSRDTCAANTVSHYSFNSNYYSQFMDLIDESSKVFSSISLHNERMDVIAYAPEQLILAKRIGLKRISSPIEGLGERVRNKILNKNLDRETLMKAMKNIFHLRLLNVKMGIVLTGQETEADIDDFISELDEIQKIRDAEGANSALQINCTPLVLYSQIALRYLPRITARASFNSERNMGKLIEYCRAHSIRIKFNGRGPGTWIEQLILDFGPAGTQSLLEVTMNDGANYYAHFNDKDKEAWVKSMKSRGYEPLWFIHERPHDWIFPSDHIEYTTDRVIQMWKDRHEKNNFDTRLCLKTLANPNPKCHGCQICTPEHIKFMVNRPMNDKHTLDQVVEALSESRHVDSSRIVVEQNSDWFFYDRTALSHYLTSQILQADASLADAFYSVGKNCLNWVSENGQKCWYQGVWVFDINWKRRVSKLELDRVVDIVNSKMTVCKIKSVYAETKDLRVDRNLYLSFLGMTSDYSVSQLTDKLVNFGWEVKVAQKVMGSVLDTANEYHPELKERFLLVPYRDKVMVYMSVPSFINPYLVMSSIIGKGYEKMLNSWDFKLIDVVKEVDGVCKCSNHIGYSMITGKYAKNCPVCQGKMILTMLTRSK